LTTQAPVAAIAASLVQPAAAVTPAPAQPTPVATTPAKAAPIAAAMPTVQAPAPAPAAPGADQTPAAPAPAADAPAQPTPAPAGAPQPALPQHPTAAPAAQPQPAQTPVPQGADAPAAQAGATRAPAEPTPAAAAPEPQPAQAPAPAQVAPVVAPAAPAPAPIAHPAAAPQPSVPMHRAADATGLLLRVAADNGISRARLNLRPAELGGIEVRLQSSPAGISAHLIADSPEAARLLSQAGDDLKRQLADSDVKLLSLDVSTTGDERRDAPAGGAASGFGDRDDSGRPSTPSRGELGSTATQTTDPEPAETTIALPGGLLVDVLA
jgi:flagellar hook-length control protein FliK